VTDSSPHLGGDSHGREVDGWRRAAVETALAVVVWSSREEWDSVEELVVV
jgi:hypothetical protein